MGHSVHPQAQQILDGKAASGVPPLWELTPAEARAVVDANARDHRGRARRGLGARHRDPLARRAGCRPGVLAVRRRARRRRLLPRRRLGGRLGRRLGRVLPRAGGRVRVRRGERGLPARARARLPRRGRRRVRRAGLGRLGRTGSPPGGRSSSRATARAATWRPVTALRARDAGGPAAGPAGAGVPGDRLRPGPAVLPRVRRGRAHREPGRHGLVLGPLRARPGRPGQPLRLAAARRATCPGCRPRT